MRAPRHIQKQARRALLRRYEICAAGTIGALLIELALRPSVYAMPLLGFTLAVAVVTRYAGRMAGLITLGVLAVVNMLLPDPMANPSRVLSTGIFLLAGGVISHMISIRDVVAAELHLKCQRFELLANASAELDRSLDYQTTLSAVTRMMVPTLADWSVILLCEDGKRERVAVAGPSPEQVEIANQLWDSTPFDPNATRGVANVLRTGEPELLTDIDHTQLDQEFPDYQQRSLIKLIGVCSNILLPIKRKNESIGVLVLVMSHSGRHYDAQDLPFASLLAARAGLAIERARLYRQTEQERGRAELACHAKDQFVAMLGHELRNPLAPILTALELMNMHDPTALRKERSVIERQVGQLTTLVDDLLDTARITRGTLELHRRPVELTEVIGHGIEIALPLVEARRHELRLDVQPGVMVDGDPERLAQVFGNLVTNAAKYSEPGGQIDIVGAREADQVVVRVRDRGVGIAADLLPHIFEMFVQAPQEVDRRRGGLGLGLAIVRNLVALHGGVVSASSEGPGRGSEFVVRLPVHDAHVIASPPPSRPEHHPGRRVLVVDDNPDALSLLADALDDRGYATARAHDGPSALAVAAQLHPEVALLDIGLPVMDGYELAHLLQEANQAVKLVAVTGYGQPGDFERTQRAGFAAHLVKPISLETVQATIDRLVA